MREKGRFPLIFSSSSFPLFREREDISAFIAAWAAAAAKQCATQGMDEGDGQKKVKGDPGG